jgi:TrmH family RNA methyltransferase
VLRRARLVLVADGVEYAGNLGALLRTVDASGADALLVTNPVGRLTHPTVFSASRGTLLTTPSLVFDSVEAARRQLDVAGFEIVIADPDASVDFRDARYGGRPTAIVVGSEGSGISADWRTGDVQPVSIAMRGKADSLNVATAAAVLLFAAGH